mmetsp:Transcript_26009/g.38475  ORF Transcript_26009/g.38475 Transcript_26009/m.38475 type:complete len:101 (+) Transcript_26009:289-591(+)
MNTTGQKQRKEMPSQKNRKLLRLFDNYPRSRCRVCIFLILIMNLHSTHNAAESPENTIATCYNLNFSHQRTSLLRNNPSFSTCIKKKNQIVNYDHQNSWS